MKPNKPQKPTRARLEATIAELRASRGASLSIAHDQLGSCNRVRMMASGLIISITNIDGSQRVEPFLCTDGFSDETIAALRNQIRYTNDKALDYSLPCANKEPTL
jgi:hypothetical protein